MWCSVKMMALRKVGRWLSGLTRRHRVGNLSTRLLNGAAKNTFSGNRRGVNGTHHLTNANFRMAKNLQNAYSAGLEAQREHKRKLIEAQRKATAGAPVRPSSSQGNRRSVNARNAKNDRVLKRINDKADSKRKAESKRINKAASNRVNEAMRKESTRVIKDAIIDRSANVHTAELLTMPITKVGHISILKSEGALQKLRALSLFPLGKVSNIKSLVTAIEDRTLANVESLDLHKCGIDAARATTLAHAMAQGTMRSLQSLSLDHNKIGDDGMRELANVMWSLPRLKQLNLASIEISDAGLDSLIKSMSNEWLRDLEQLVLTGNPAISSRPTNEGLVHFSRGLDELGKIIQLGKLPNLKQLYIENEKHVFQRKNNKKNANSNPKTPRMSSHAFADTLPISKHLATVCEKWKITINKNGEAKEFFASTNYE